jgi:hypothetical protein
MKVERLEQFEVFYRGLGLLGSGFRTSQEDRAFADSLGAAEELAQSRWLARAASYKSEMELLGEIHGSNVLKWWREFVDYGELFDGLARISRGNFMPPDLVRDSHEVEGHGWFSEFRATIGGVKRWMYLPDAKHTRDDAFAEVNRWITHTGRQFAEVGVWGPNGEPLFACISEDDATALKERDVDARFPQAWETEPRALLPLVEQFWAEGAYARVLDVTSFNESLGERAPKLHLYRGLSRKALGDEASAWKDIAAAQERGIKDAAEQLEAIAVGDGPPRSAQRSP